MYSIQEIKVGHEQRESTNCILTSKQNVAWIKIKKREKTRPFLLHNL